MCWSCSSGHEVDEDEGGPTRGRPLLANVVQRLGKGATTDAEGLKGFKVVGRSTSPYDERLRER